MLGNGFVVQQRIEDNLVSVWSPVPFHGAAQAKSNNKFLFLLVKIMHFLQSPVCRDVWVVDIEWRLLSDGS